MRERKWSSTERAVARRAFDRVLAAGVGCGHTIDKRDSSEDQAATPTVETEVDAM
jgi:hypothetical protein